MDLKPYIRQMPDFPRQGILFYDMSPLLACPDAWQVALGRMARQVLAHAPEVLGGVESRGFLLAAPLALKLGCSAGAAKRCITAWKAVRSLLSRQNTLCSASPLAS